MRKDLHPHAGLIDDIGRSHVRSALNLTPQALYNWRRRGIPMSKLAAVKRVAAEKGVTTPPDFLAPLTEMLAA